MVLAANKPKLVNLNGTRLRRGAARIALVGPALTAARRAKAREKDQVMQKRAQLMLAARMNIHVTAEVPAGNFTIIDPETMDAGERALCPFKAKTVVVHPDDLDRAIAQFAAGNKAPAPEAEAQKETGGHA